MRRKFGTVLAALTAVTLGLAACSTVGEDGETTEPTGTSSATEGGEEPAAGPFTIGVSNGFVGSEYRTQMIQDIEEAAAPYQEEGLLEDLVLENADTDVNGQIQQVRNLINSGVDAIIINPNSGTALDAVFQEAADQDILVFAIDQAVESESVINVGIDQAAWARTSAEWLAEQVGEGGNVVVVNGISGHPANEARWNAAKEALEAGGVNILTTVDGGWDQTTGQQQMTTLLSTYPEIDGVWTQDGMAQGVLQALIEAGKQNDVIVSGEARGGFMRLWEEHGLDSVAVVNPPGTGATALHFAMGMLQGQTIKDDALTDGHNVVLELEPTITNENFDEVWAEHKDKPDTYVLDSILSKDEVGQMLE
ncbi:substrate-binding domain-containing protein [Tessaracoccus oleiagri]|uniref:Monosaccharide ABC transporter substrate-binding protein, CUT2 family n=1 Tax=Tessaracoccus oleiagri TaxID=686624 RepID=A0A1G9J806_9ACTN|nr:substrate-binding domain-containing protein [Tessaracoccus oleiagri]SDL33366.1 monosaccharide ABC transporter substrate-binding protein, CUT2 family [Tessaracoccus oleiagri]